MRASFIGFKRVYFEDLDVKVINCDALSLGSGIRCQKINLKNKIHQ